MHFNQVIGATYKISSDVTAYAGFSEADRAPISGLAALRSPTRVR